MRLKIEQRKEGKGSKVSSSDVEKSEGDDDESGVVETESVEYEEEDESELSLEFPKQTLEFPLRTPKTSHRATFLHPIAVVEAPENIIKRGD
ncbi:50S ribosomal protein L12 [Sarracenia purpurea var. burkii]